MPVDEFNNTLREIFAGTNKGKQLVLDIIEDIKSNIELDEMAELTEEEGDGVKEKDLSIKQLQDLLNREDFDDILGGMMG